MTETRIAMAVHSCKIRQDDVIGWHLYDKMPVQD